MIAVLPGQISKEIYIIDFEIGKNVFFKVFNSLIGSASKFKFWAIF